MSREDSLVLLASAGTGKTFRLTNRLLALYASDVPPRRILASTFTRKAAGEILQRLVVRLSEACASDAACAKLADEIGVAIDRANAIELCLQLLRHVDRLRVSTLDSWFQERVQRASFELGLPADWDVCDPQLEKRLGARALSRVLDRPRSSLEWSTLIADLKRGGAQSRVHAGLLESLARAARFVRECPPEAWEFPPPVADAAQAAVERALGDFERLDVPQKKAGGDRVNYVNARTRLVQQVRSESWFELGMHTLIQRALEDTPVFDRIAVPQDWLDCLRVFAQRSAHRAAAQVRAQNLALRALAADFVSELDAATLRERRLSFDALPRMLAAQPREIAAGLDVDHLLLDEFQDTSSLQWRALEPGVDALLVRPEGSFFCVGDVKQSIYGWRDGNPLLLAQLSERLLLPSETLALSYRSSPVLLDFVNTIFETLDDNRALADDAARLAGKRFHAAFVRHEANDPSLEGRVRLWRCLRDTDDDSQAACERSRVELAVACALELRLAQPDWSLAFLVRSKKLLPALLERLKEAGLDASGEGGNPLTDSSAVNAALSLLEFADHPEDDYLVLHLATSPLAGHAGLSYPPDARTKQAAAFELRRAWLELGPAAFLARLEPSVREHYGDFDRRRFAQLLALAQTLDPTEPLRPAQFAERLAQERVPDPTNSRIQVMTVHGAKGLEFDAVILMDLDSVLGKAERGGLVARRQGGDPRAPYDVVTHALPADEAALLPSLQALQSESKALRVQEELCVLYVALTRAKQHLDLIIDDPGDNQARNSCAGLLLQALGTDPLPEGSLIWDSEWQAPLRRAPSAGALSTPPPAAELPRLQLVPAAAWGTRVPSRQRVVAARATSELFEDHRPERRRGGLWHAWLERIDWLDGELPELATLIAWARAFAPSAADAGEAKEFLRALAQPEVRAELSRGPSALRLGAAAGELELLREQRFAFVRANESSGELVQGALDRAVVARAQQRAEIVDFKSDALPAGDLARLRARAEGYRPQLELYREALARLESLDPQRIELRVCFVAVGRSVVLSPSVEQGP